MNCPLCAYESPYAAMRCPSCRTVFDSEALETLWHLVYLRERLLRWRMEGVLRPDAAAAALAATQQEITALHTRLVAGSREAAAVAEPATADATVPHTEPAAAADLAHSPALGASTVGSASAIADGAVDGAAPADESIPTGDVDDAEADVPAAPAGPSFALRDIGTYLLSERTLHGLLGLGALLILASGVVISTLNPTGLGPFPHLGAVVATTLLFFVAGYVVRQRLHLTIAGATLLGIAGAFVPMMIWTLGQERLLNWETGAIWLVSSLVSLPLYLAVHRILGDRTFAVLAAIAGGSEVLAVVNWLGVPLEWGLAALVLLAIGYLRLSWRLRTRSVVLSWAMAWAAQAATPILMTLLLVARLGSDAWLATFGRPLSNWGEYAIGAGWWLGTMFYLQSDRLHHRRWDVYAAAWTVPVAYLLTLTRAPWGASWYGFCLGVLALGYVLLGYRQIARNGATTLPPPYGALMRSPFFQVVGVLVLVAAFWPLQTAPSRIATLTLLAGLFALATRLLRLRPTAWLSVTLLGVAYGLALPFHQVAGDARPLAWAILAAALLAAGEIAVRRSGEADRSLLRTMVGGRIWESRFGAPLFAAGYLVCGIALVLALAGYWQAPSLGGARRLSTTAIAGFVAVLATLTVSSVARRTGFFLYVVPWLALIPLTAGAALLFERIAWTLHEPEVARLLAGASAIFVTIAVLVDRENGRYARPLYLAGYLLLPGAMLLSLLDRTASVQVVGFSILVYAVSATLTHLGRLNSWDRLVERVCGSSTTVAARSVRAFWVYLAVWLLPAWAMLLTSLWEPPISWYALVLSGLALSYPAIGLWIRRVGEEYRWPWYLGGYALSAMAPLVALTDATMRPVVLGLSIGLYVVSAIVGRRSAWLYPAAALGPVLLWQALGSLDQFERWYGVGLVVLAMVYGAVGVWLQPIGTTDVDETGGRFLIRGSVGGYALPFLVVGYVLSALGLARAANQEAGLATLTFGLAAVQYAGSALVFRQPVFGWATAGLVLVTYVVGLSLTPLDPNHRGLGLLPAGLLALLVGEVLRRRVETPPPDIFPVDEAPHPPTPSPARGRGGAGWSLPWYVVAGGIAVAMPWWSTADQRVWALAWWSGALLFGAMTVLLRHPLWLYPALGFGIVGFLATGYVLDAELPAARSYATLAGLAWIFMAAAWIVDRRGSPLPQPLPLVRERGDGPSEVGRPDAATGDGRVDDRVRGRIGDVAALGRRSLTGWVAPLLVAGWVTLVGACIGSLPSAKDGLAAAASAGVLTIVMGVVRGGAGYAWVSVAVLALAFQHGLRVGEVAGRFQAVYWAGASLATIVLAQMFGWRPARLLALWVQPLTWASGLIAVGAVIAAALVEARLLNRDALQSLALSVAIVGLTATGHAYARQDRRLVYLGVGLLDVGLLLELYVYEVGQPQAFALPVGSYLLAVAFLEWRRGAPRLVKRPLEIAGLIVLLGISLLQAIGLAGAGYERFVYDTFLLVESTVLLGLGAILRWRYTFFGAALAVVVDLGILLVDPLKALNTWYLVALIGLVLIGAVIWIERQRQKIPLWLENLRTRLERWD